METFMNILQNFGVLAAMCFAMGYYIYMQHKTYRDDISKITSQHKEEICELNDKNAEMLASMRQAIDRNTEAMNNLRVLLGGKMNNA